MEAPIKWAGFKGRSSISFLLGSLVTAGLFLVIPITQMASRNDDQRQHEYISVSLQPPPPPAPELEKKEEEPPKEEEDPEFKKDFKPLDLSTLSLLLETGVSSDSVGVFVGDFIVDDSVLLDSNIFEIEDLDAVPRAILQIKPIYPSNLKRMGVEGDVMIECIVDVQGNVRRPRVIKTTNHEFDKPVLRAIRQWKFEPGKKNNKAVNTRVRIPLNMRLHS